MAVQDVIAEIQALMRTLTGVRAAPEYPPDKTAATPAIITFAQSGVWRGNTPEDIRGLHNIVIEVRVAHRELDRAVETVMRYSDLVPETLFAALRDGRLTKLSTFGPIEYTLDGVEEADVVVLRLRFTLRDVKTVVDL